MAFRHRIFKPLRFTPVPVQVMKQVSNFDSDGVEHVSFVEVSAQSVIDSMPSPSETTLMSQMQAGTLKPVSLDDFQLDNVDSSTASSIINSLNVEQNENS